MTSDEQLEQWVAGNSIHNDEVFITSRDASGKVTGKFKLDGGECCPDFSCCHSDLKWEEKARQAFAQAKANKDNQTVSRMLGMALDALLAKQTDKKVHVVSSDNPTTH